MVTRAHIWFASFVVILFAAGVASGVALDRTMGWGHRPTGFGFRGGPGGSPSGSGIPGGGRGMGGPGGRGGRDGRDGGPPTEGFVNELDQALTLTADQKTRITSIIEASRPRLRTLQEEMSKKFSDEQQSLNDAISRLLTPEQAKKLEAMQKERRGGPFGFRDRGGRGRGDRDQDHK